MQIDYRRTPAEIILAPDPSCVFRRRNFPSFPRETCQRGFACADNREIAEIAPQMSAARNGVFSAIS
jgi:hypothetical protein